MSHAIRAAFEEMNAQLRQLEKKYKPENGNLHFASEAIPEVDATLFHELLKLSRKAIEIVKDEDQRYSNKTAYAHTMFDFWYEYFLLISSASLRILESGKPEDIPNDVIARIIEDLINISGFSTIVSGDLYFRNSEALGNTLLAFHDEKIIDSINVNYKSTASDSIKGFLVATIESVENSMKNRK